MPEVTLLAPKQTKKNKKRKTKKSETISGYKAT
jgi:hypothetical protein